MLFMNSPPIEVLTLVESSIKCAGKYAHLYDPQELAELPHNLLEKLVYHIGPLTLLLLEQHLLQSGRMSISTDHIWQELLRIRWPYKYQTTAQVFKGTEEQRSPRKAYLELHCKHLLHQQTGNTIGAPVYHLFPFIHLSSLTELRNAHLVGFNNPFLPRSPTPDKDITFYASYISTLVINSKQLPYILTKADFLQAICHNIKALHVHFLHNKSYAHLRRLIVTLQYRGVLEEVVMFDTRLNLRYFKELVLIMAGHGHNITNQILSEPLHSSKCVSQNVESKSDQTADSNNDLDYVTKDILESNFTVADNSGDFTQEHNELQELETELDYLYDFSDSDSHTGHVSDEDPMFEDVYNGSAKDHELPDVQRFIHGPLNGVTYEMQSDIGSKQFYIANTEAKVYLDTCELDKMKLEKGLLGFGVYFPVVDDAESGESMENVLEEVFQSWPRLTKVALPNLGICNVADLLGKLVTTNKMQRIVIDNLRSSSCLPVDVIDKLVHVKERTCPIECLRMTSFKYGPHLSSLLGQAIPRTVSIPSAPFHGFTELDVSHSEFGHLEIYKSLFNYIKHDKDLRTVRADGTRLMDYGLVKAVLENGCIEALSLSCTGRMSIETLTCILTSLPKLRCLNVSQCRISMKGCSVPEAFSLVKKIVQHPSLVDINLSWNKLNHIGVLIVEGLMEAVNPRLRRLQLGNNHTDERQFIDIGKMLVKRKAGSPGSPFFLDHLFLTHKYFHHTQFYTFHEVVRDFVLERETCIAGPAFADYMAMM